MYTRRMSSHIALAFDRSAYISHTNLLLVVRFISVCISLCVSCAAQLCSGLPRRVIYLHLTPHSYARAFAHTERK